MYVLSEKAGATDRQPDKEREREAQAESLRVGVLRKELYLTSYKLWQCLKY